MAAVVLLHGLAVGPWVMAPLARELRGAGHRVVNLACPTRRVPLETLAGTWLPAALATHGVGCAAAAAERFHLVTHSMGGLVARGWLAARGVPPALHRVVMIAPPHHGTRLVDRLNRWHLTGLTGINGPRLGTSAKAYPRRLPARWPEGPELGIIAGDRSLTPFGAWLTGGPGDGKVTVESTRLPGQRAHLVLPHSHTLILWRRTTFAATRHFLAHGCFPGGSTDRGR
jgi:triacylglycerol lipase